MPVDNLADRLAIEPLPKDEQPVKARATIVIAANLNVHKWVFNNCDRKWDVINKVRNQSKILLKVMLGALVARVNSWCFVLFTQFVKNVDVKIMEWFWKENYFL